MGRVVTSKGDRGMVSVGLDWHALKDCRILVIDDQELVRSLIGNILSSAGLERVTFAVDGEDGLAKAEEVRPDLIVLDIMMPRVDGFAVLEALRVDARWSEVPVLVLTAADDHEIRGRVFMAGATDFISKPLNRLEFLARLKVHLSNWVLVRRLESQLHRIEAELREAQRMQAALLPGAEALDEVHRRYAVSVHHHFECSSQVGGDCWTVRPIGDSTLGVLICDFSGHGVSAAMNTVRLHTLLAEHPFGDGDPAAYLGVLNRNLADLLPCGQFATLLFGVIDTAADSFTYAAASAPDPFTGAVTPGAAIARMDGSGLPLGIDRDATYDNITVPFAPGDFLFLYSDALYEGVPVPKGVSQRRMFFEEFPRLVGGMDGAAALPHLLDWFYARSPRPPKDDLTAVWLQRAV